MKELIHSPPFTVLASLPSLARNVGCVNVSTVNADDERTVSVSLEGDRLRWQHGSSCAFVARGCIKAVSLVPLANNGENFAAVVLSFFGSDGEISRYRLVTSHISELEWLAALAEDVGQMVDLEVSNELDAQ